MGRIMALDYGSKRCGIAVTDDLQMIATPLTTVATYDLEDFIKDYVRREKPECLVIGLPMHRDGQPVELEHHIKGLVRRLGMAHPKLKIERMDERFTSKMALDTLIRAGTKKSTRRDKSLIDKVSAAIILQSYLDSKSRGA